MQSKNLIILKLFLVAGLYSFDCNTLESRLYWPQFCNMITVCVELYLYTVKAKWLSGEALQIAVKRREAKSKGEKERNIHLNAEFQRTARRDKKAFLSDQCQEIEEHNRMERLEISSRKLAKPREYFMQS